MNSANYTFAPTLPVPLVGASAIARFQDFLFSAKGTAFAVPKGIDIVAIGDSRTWGSMSDTGTPYSRFEGWVHLLKLDLQAAYNPSGVTGGYGLLLFQDNPTASGLGFSPTTQGGNVSATGSPTYSTDPSASSGLGLRHMTTTSTLGYYLNSDDDASGYATYNLKLGTTDFELVYETQSSGGTFVVKIQEDAGATSFTAASTSTNATADYGVRSARYQFSSATGLGASFGATDFRIRVDTDASLSCKFQGLILYNGDYSSGVRVHNCGASGSKLSQYSANALTALDKFGAGGSTGATNAKLVTINVGGFNELQALQSAATFQSTIDAMVARVTAWTSAPSVLLIIDPRPPMDGAPFTAGTHLPLYLAYKQAVYAVQKKYYNVCSILDADAHSEYSAVVATSSGLIQTTDDLHHKRQGHQLQAKLVYSAITTARQS